jgi:L,D-peptidoglycan transpeptidase YkuD (ErfK/YbiS/YcfS/YnhG family)
MCNMRSCAGVTGQPAWYVDGTSAAVIAVTVPRNEAAAAVVVVVVGATVVVTVVGAATVVVVVVPGTVVVAGSVEVLETTGAAEVEVDEPQAVVATSATAITAHRRTNTVRRIGRVRARGTALPMSLATLALIASACGGSSSHARAPAVARSTIASTTTIAASSTTRVTVAPSSSSPATVAASIPPPTAPPTPAPTTAAPPSLLVTRISGLGSAGQAVVVAAGGYGTSTATLTAYQRNPPGQRDPSEWTQVFGPWEAHIGRNGVAPTGQKREGDGRTPSGVFGFDFMFGVNPNPGVKFPFRAITGANIVWDDDPASPNYNEWIDTDTADAGAAPEPMHVGAYGSGAVIAYNDARTPGLGSAIFLHLSTGGSTAGCVSLPGRELLPLLRWLDPARAPRIAIGTFTAS